MLKILKEIKELIDSIKKRDPAAKSGIEVFLLYPGFRAVMHHRAAHWFYKRRLFFIARYISQRGRHKTGIEIHPGAKIGRNLFIDHGTGVVIGETTVIGDDCTIYQGATLGGTGKDTGKRHPTLGSNIVVGAGAKILGPFTVGDNSKIAAGAVVLSAVPENSTAVGIPARIVRKENKKITPETQMDNIHIPDPLSQELCKLDMRVFNLEKEIKKDVSDINNISGGKNNE